MFVYVYCCCKRSETAADIQKNSTYSNTTLFGSCTCAAPDELSHSYTLLISSFWRKLEICSE